MKQKTKYWIKKFIPAFLLPYTLVFYNKLLSKYISVLNEKSFKEFFNSLLELKKILKQDSIRIIQPTYFDITGEKYISGGAEIYVTDLCSIIKEMGYTPYIIQMGSHNWHKKHEGIDVFGVKSMDFKGLSFFSHHKVFGTPKLVIYSPFVIASDRAFKKSIGISHGIFWDNKLNSVIINNVIKAYKSLENIVSVDTATISWFRATVHSLTDINRIKHIPNYVDLSKYSPIELKRETKKLVVTFPRRLHVSRGYFLVEAIIEKLILKFPHVEIHFVGYCDDPDIEKSRKEITKKFVSNVLYYMCPADKMPEIYQNSDITLIPTVHSEGTSLSCLEAMACGNAVIATNVGGLTDLIINEHNGLLISPNSDELFDAICRLIEDEKLRKFIGVKASEVADTFNKKIWKEKWRSILKKVI